MTIVYVSSISRGTGMNVELRHLRYFVAVAEELHFRRAAERLHITQPTLSRQIRALEEEIGAELFDRSRRSVALTAAGRTLLPEARAMLTGVSRALEVARRVGQGSAGNLRIGFVGSASYGPLPNLLSSLQTAAPDLEITLREMTGPDQVEALRRSDIDAGLLRPPIYDARGIEMTEVHREPLVAALPASHPLAGDRAEAGVKAEENAGMQDHFDLSQLADEPFVLFPRWVGPGVYDRIIAACREAGFSPRVEQEAVQLQTITGLVSGGIGVSVLPGSIRTLGRTGVAYRLLKRTSEVEIAAAWLEENEDPVLRTLKSVLRS